ncbi:MAG: murein biosynthesis integral membrane protein MurJ [Chloroflexi bacterium]|nr:murein biosynthesis integral membrane protein MurJ [Chloroflexota bacterium]
MEEIQTDVVNAQPSVARSAAMLSLGNVLSRVLGMVREIIIPHYFGATGYVSAFRTAEFVVKTMYDLLVGGMLSAALVPVLSDYARHERRQDFARVASAVFTMLAAVSALAVLGIELFAPAIVGLLGKELPLEFQETAVRLMRLMAPVVWVFSSSGVLAAVLYARQRFTKVALGDGLYNLGVIVAVPLLHNRLGVQSLALGIFLGSLIQLGLRLPDLRDLGLRLTLQMRHPALRRVWLLYLPVLASLIVSMIQGGIDTRLANSTGERSLSYMRQATTLYQFPHGLVAVAISLAALPALSRWAAVKDWDAYRHTLGASLRLVLVLSVPATVGLWVLAEPVVRLLAEHGEFTAMDTYWTALTLRYYLVGLIFASIDWPLNFAFYARHDSRTPALVGILSVFVYLAVALSLLPTLSFLGLALADGAKQAAHALVMVVLIYRWGGRLGQGVGWTAIVTLLASVVMGVVVWGVSQTLLGQVGTAGVLNRLWVVGGSAAVGSGVYYGLLRICRVPEIGVLHGLAQRLRLKLGHR